MDIPDIPPPPHPSPAEQEDALRKGLGRVVLWARAGRLDTGLLLDACLHEKAYDMQVEGTRGPWMWQVLTAAGRVDDFREAILAALASVSAEREMYQLCHLVGEYARRGDGRLLTGLYQFVDRRPLADGSTLGEDELLAADGERAFSFLARRRGERLRSEEWEWYDDAMVGKAIERLGEPRVRALMNDFTDADQQRFAARWREQPPRRPPSAYPAAEYHHVNTETVQDVLEAAVQPGKQYWLRRWSRWAKPDEVEQIWGAVRSTREPDAIAKLLWAVSRQPLPRFDPLLIELCRHADREVRRAAEETLSMNAHQLVRRFALECLELPIPDVAPAVLLLRNYEPGDERRLADGLELLEDVDERHWQLSQILDLLEKHPAADAAALGLIIYFETPCPHCRRKAVQLLAERECAPAWLLEECRHDSSEECREFMANRST